MDANQRFATTVLEQYHEGDLVWIQDYHLLLVPMLLARRHIAPVGLFLHVPFPSSEIFRTLSVRDEILRGMLAADHIGFHLFEYARHFLTSCRRLLGLTHTSRRGGCLAIDYQGREVMVTVSHVGIEPEYLLRRFTGTQFIATSAAEWRRMFPGRSILGGIDSIERLRGVPHKLLAFENLLVRHPEVASQAVMVQICVEDTVRPGDKQEATVREIRELADRINSRFGTRSCPVVHLVIRSTSVHMSERLALWAATDVLVNTTIRDSRSLHAFEYVFARGSGQCVPAASNGATAALAAGRDGAQLALQACEQLTGLNKGALILSEFAGSSRVLPGAFRVSPWKQDDMVAAMLHAVTMSDEEAAVRADANLQYVRGNTTSSWAERVLLDLKTFSKRGSSRTYMGYGLGLGYRLMGFGASFRPLNFEHVITAYKRSTHRLIVCDYGGTLNVRDSSTLRRQAFELGLLHGKDAAPPLAADTRKALRILADDPRNTVFVISGKEKEVLQQAFASLPNVGLAAEHGYYYRWGCPPSSLVKKAGGAPGAATPVTATATPAAPIAGGGSKAGAKQQQSNLDGSAGAGAGNLRITAMHRSASRASNNTADSPLPGRGLRDQHSDRDGRSDRDSAGRGSDGGGGAARAGAAGAAGASDAAEVEGDNGMPWLTLTTMASDDWKALAAGIMEMYAARTNGTYILRKNSAISWHFGDADTEFGSMQAKELQDHLAGVMATAACPVDVLSGHDYVEVRPKGVSKGVVLARIMDTLEGRDAHRHHHHHRHQHNVSTSSLAAAGIGSGTGVGASANAASASNAAAAPTATAPASGTAQQPQAPAAPAALTALRTGGHGLTYSDSMASTASAGGRSESTEETGPGTGPHQSAFGTPTHAATAHSSSAAAAAQRPASSPQYGSQQRRSSTSGTGASSSAALQPPYRKARPLEFILCIGDDLADEAMFTTIVSYRKERWEEHRAILAHIGSKKAAELGLAGGTAGGAGGGASSMSGTTPAAPGTGRRGSNVTVVTSGAAGPAPTSTSASTRSASASTNVPSAAGAGGGDIAETAEGAGVEAAMRVSKFGMGGILSTVPETHTPMTPIGGSIRAHATHAHAAAARHAHGAGTGHHEHRHSNLVPSSAAASAAPADGVDSASSTGVIRPPLAPIRAGEHPSSSAAAAAAGGVADQKQPQPSTGTAASSAAPGSQNVPPPTAHQPQQPASSVTSTPLPGQSNVSMATNANTTPAGAIPSAQPLTYYEYTVTVGKKPSSAQYFLDDTQQTEDLLKSLARASLSSRTKASAGAAGGVPAALNLGAAAGGAVGGLQGVAPMITTSAAPGGGAASARLTQMALVQSYQSRVRAAGGGAAADVATALASPPGAVLPSGTMATAAVPGPYAAAPASPAAVGGAGGLQYYSSPASVAGGGAAVQFASPSQQQVDTAQLAAQYGAAALMGLASTRPNTTPITAGTMAQFTTQFGPGSLIFPSPSGGGAAAGAAGMSASVPMAGVVPGQGQGPPSGMTSADLATLLNFAGSTTNIAGMHTNVMLDPSFLQSLGLAPRPGGGVQPAGTSSAAGPATGTVAGAPTSAGPSPRAGQSIAGGVAGVSPSAAAATAAAAQGARSTWTPSSFQPSFFLPASVLDMSAVQRAVQAQMMGGAGAAAGMITHGGTGVHHVGFSAPQASILHQQAVSASSAGSFGGVAATGAMSAASTSPVSSIAGQLGVARQAPGVWTGFPGAMAALYASTNRLHTLASVPEHGSAANAGSYSGYAGGGSAGSGGLSPGRQGALTPGSGLANGRGGTLGQGLFGSPADGTGADGGDHDGNGILHGRLDDEEDELDDRDEDEDEEREEESHGGSLSGDFDDEEELASGAGSGVGGGRGAVGGGRRNAPAGTEQVAPTMSATAYQSTPSAMQAQQLFGTSRPAATAAAASGGRVGGFNSDTRRVMSVPAFSTLIIPQMQQQQQVGGSGSGGGGVIPGWPAAGLGSATATGQSSAGSGAVGSPVAQLQFPINLQPQQAGAAFAPQAALASPGATLAGLGATGLPAAALAGLGVGQVGGTPLILRSGSMGSLSAMQPAMSCGATYNTAQKALLTANMSSGLGQYFDRIAEANEDETPEF